MKRKISILGICVFSLLLLFGGCAKELLPVEMSEVPKVSADVGTAEPDATTSPIPTSATTHPTAAAAEQITPMESHTSEAQALPTQTVQPGKSITVATPTAAPNNGSGNAESVGGGNSGSGTIAESPADHSAAAPPAPNADKTWYDAVYEDVWVVDQPAYTVEEPIYEKQERTICKICGADITGNIPAHGDMHFDNGEDFSYGGELVDVQIGVRQVTIPEQGHFEQQLVREAGWY